MFEEVSKLIVFQKSHQLVLNIYSLTRQFPSEEKFGLISQIRRAAVSIPSNIVEGKGRGSAKELIHFLLISRGSLEEVKYQIFLAKDLGYLSVEAFNGVSMQTEEIGKLLNGFISSLRKNLNT